MEFEKDYWHSMSKEAALQYNISPRSLGISTPPMEHQLKALSAKVKEGASVVELGFLGQGKGSLQGGNVTPGMHSVQQREDMRQLAKLNEMTLTTHAACQLSGFSGFNQDRFDKNLKNKNVTEVKRAIDFAADVAEGGPVTVHLGEFPRPITGVGGEFTGYPEEAKEKVHYLVDSKTGQIISAVKEDQDLYAPKYKEEDGKPVYKLNSEGKPIEYEHPAIKDRREKVRLSETYGADDPYGREGEIVIEKIPYAEYYKNKIELLKKEGDKAGFTEEDIPKLFYSEFVQGQIEQSAGQADEYEVTYRRMLEDSKRILKEIEHVKKIESNMTEEEKEKTKQEYLRTSFPGVSIVPIKKELPSEYLQKSLWEINKNMAYGEETAKSARKNIREIKDRIQRLEPIEQYGLQQTSEGLAQLGLHAMRKQKEHKLDRDLFISPEAVFPEAYGGHPDEQRKIIKEARKVMAEKLVEKGTSKKEAEKLASKHIRATFDSGHLTCWKKYYTGKDEDFNKWVGEQARKMVKEDILGHVHLTDNFGYEDEHLAPGEGTMPIAGFVKELRKAGYKGPMIVEPGAQERQIDALKGALRSFNSPVYRIDGASISWADVEHGYFGRTIGPSYVVGAYAPDIGIPTEHRTWTFWSGVPLE